MEAIAIEPEVLPARARATVKNIVRVLRQYRLSEGSQATAIDSARNVRELLVSWFKSMKLTELRGELDESFGPLVTQVVLPDVSLGRDDARIGLGCGPEAIRMSSSIGSPNDLSE